MRLARNIVLAFAGALLIVYAINLVLEQLLLRH